MSKGSNPGSVTTTSSQEPSDFIKPYFQQAIDSAQDLYEGSSPNFFPNATYTDFAPETSTALNLTSARALAGNPLLNQSQTEASNILAGNYLNPSTNPYSKALYDQMAGDVMSDVNSQFTSAGRFGSGANQEILTQELGQLANQVYGDQYNRERELMANTMATAPGLGEMDYNDIAKLQGVGVEKESLENAKLQDAINRFDYNETKPYNKLNQYLASLGASVPSNTLETSPVFRNTGAGLLKGAGTGMNLASQLGVNPLYGAIGGGLLGGFA